MLVLLSEVVDAEFWSMVAKIGGAMNVIDGAWNARQVITLHAQTPGPAACPDYWRIGTVNDQAMLSFKFGAYVVSSPVSTVNGIPVRASFVKATAHSEH